MKLAHWTAVLTLATIIGLVLLAGRIYTNAILHSGPRLSLQDAWRGATAPGGDLRRRCWDDQRLGQRAGCAMVSRTAVIASISAGFCPGATLTP